MEIIAYDDIESMEWHVFGSYYMFNKNDAAWFYELSYCKNCPYVRWDVVKQRSRQDSEEVATGIAMTKDDAESIAISVLCDMTDEVNL